MHQLPLRAIFYNLFNDAFAVGSIVTIAVNIAKIGVRSSIKQNSDVKKVARPVLIVLAPIIFFVPFIHMINPLVVRK